MTVESRHLDWVKQTGFAKWIGRAASNRVFYERLGMTLMALVVLLLSVVTWLRPGYNWDMVAYIATALENRIEDPVQLHAETWKEIEKGANEGDLYLLRYDQPYNRHQWENPIDFVSQLPMYRVKVAYVAAMRAMAPITGLDKAAILLSILSSLAFGALCLYWLKREDALQGALILVPALGLADYLHMTTLATPDMTTALLSLAAIYLLTQKRDIAACVLLFAAVLFRPDSLILIFAILIAAVIFGWRKTPFVVTFVAAFATSMIISKLSGYPGWWTHFYFSCVQVQNSLSNFHPPFSLAAFATGYIDGVMNTLTANYWAELLLLSVAAWRLLYLAGRTSSSRFNALMFALVIGTIGKFVSFPLPDGRVYFPFIAGMTLLLITAWKPRFDVAVAART